jgi:hypothetical protein
MIELMATKIISLDCRQCDTTVVEYKKQGTGGLVRILIDRIQGPEFLHQLKQVGRKSDLPPLTCGQCGALIGTPTVYEGKRLAFRLVKGAFKKVSS